MRLGWDLNLGGSAGEQDSCETFVGPSALLLEGTLPTIRISTSIIILNITSDVSTCRCFLLEVIMGFYET